MDKKIVVIGGGPCGLGACSRLKQMGHKNFMLIDKNDYTGGLSGSFLDEKGFIWDIGVHINFSHYKYYDDLIDQGVMSYVKNFKNHHDYEPEDIGNLDRLWMKHKRECWIKFDPETWVSYPFQNNFFNITDQQVIQDCMQGMLDLYKLNNRTKPANFQELINTCFGSGLAKHFMNPYNFKVWGYPVHEMNANWVGERVSMVDFSKILADYIKFNSEEEKNQPKKEIGNWGPNSMFKYPKYGGTGSVWKGVGKLIGDEHLKLNTEIVEIDSEQKQIRLSNSQTIEYDYIINTMPIDVLVQKILKPTKRLNVEQIISKYGVPKHSSTYVVCLGFDGPMPVDLLNKSWMYFPSLERSPFYRMTAFSNYSPYLVNKPYEQSSIMFEVCETENMPDRSNIIEKVIQGALNEKIITEDDVDRIASKFMMKFEYGYPTPYLNRDAFLGEIEPILRNDLGIYSRGRFGGWKYEVANQDHSCMQGVEAADNILFGCEEQTYFYPDHVNNRKETTRRFKLQL